MTRSDSQRLSYQPALDGLRALAVVSVIVFHNGVSWMPGGFLGVDVFFVLSGYLITTLLVMEWKDPGGIDLKAFWVRRARRLLPALLLVLVAVAAYARWAADPVSIDSIRWDSLGSLFYVANWRFIFSHQSYFEAFAAPSPLRHLWSLAVEEQWYLVWPLFLSVGLKLSKKSIKPLIAVLSLLALLSTADMWWLTRGPGDPSRAYYGTDSRAHTLLVGAILAVVLRHWPIKSRGARMAAQLVGVASLVAVCCFLFFVHETDRWMYHGGFLLLALCTAGVITAAMLPVDGLVKRSLRLKPLPFIGLMSYGLYLWHWPINVWLSPERLGLDEPVTWGGVRVEGYLLVAIRVAVTGVVAFASYKLVELPIRHGALSRMSKKYKTRVPVGTMLTAASVIFVALVVLTSTTTPTGQSASGLVPAGAEGKVGGTAGPSKGVAAVTTVPIGSVENDADLPVIPADRKVKLMVGGDSIGYTLSVAQDERLPGADVRQGLEIQDRADVGCGIVYTPYFIHSQRSLFADNCADVPGHWQTGAVEFQPDVLALTVGAWEVYDHEIDGKRLKPGDAAYGKVIADDYIKGVDRALAANPNMRLVFIASGCLAERADRLGGTSSERNEPQRLKWVNGIVKQVADHYGKRALYIDMGPLVCPGGKFKKTIDGVLMREDGVHYTKPGSKIAWDYIEPKVLQFVREGKS